MPPSGGQKTNAYGKNIIELSYEKVSKKMN